MIPSQFAEENAQEAAKARQLQARIEAAKFLQSCLHKDLDRIAKDAESSESSGQVKDLSQFTTLLRTGASIPNQLIYDVAKVFRDEFVLDNLPRSQLVAMCKFLHISGPFMSGQTGDIHLRYLRQHDINQS